MRRAWSKARLRIGVEPSSKRGGETGTRKLMGELRVQESNELPKCQEESARQFVSVETLDADLTPRTRRRNRTMPPMSSLSAWVAPDGRGLLRRQARSSVSSNIRNIDSNSTPAAKYRRNSK